VSDRWVVALAVAVCAGALAVVDGHVAAAPLPAAVAVAVAGWWWLVRRHLLRAGRSARGRSTTAPWLVCLGLALLAGTLAERSLDGLRAPLATGPIRAEVVLVGDPAPDGRGGVTVDVRLDGRRLRATARLAAAAALDDRLAGERVTLLGEVRPPGPYERFLPHRHLAGRLAVDTVVGWRPGDAATRLANGLRRTLADGAAVLPDRHASLLAGVTLGDDRAQPPDMADAFQAAGLTHLLAVSGQNVAFVLAVVAPALGRLGFGPRLAATLGVLALFALVTRAEPSVLRAVAMAGVAATGAALGRPASAGRALALGVAGMVLVDPLLVTSLGFRLSVAGAAGIVAGAARVEAWLPGPRWLAAPLSVTLAAQAAVAPFLVAAFGSLPLASVPANLLAAPAAGPLMVWGLTAGLGAGLVGDAGARLLHVPTAVLLTWLDGVASAAARWPLGDVEAHDLWGLAAAGLLVAMGCRLCRADAALACRHGDRVSASRTSAAVTGHRSGPPAGTCRRSLLGRAAVVVGTFVAGSVLVAAAVPEIPATDAGPDGVPLGAGATLWAREGATVLIADGRARVPAVLAGLRDAGSDRVDVLVLRTGARSGLELADVLARARPVGAVFVPGGVVGALPRPIHRRATTPPRGTVIDVGGLRLTVAHTTEDRLDVDVTPRPDDDRATSPSVTLQSTPAVWVRAAHGRRPPTRGTVPGPRGPPPRGAYPRPL
jgi:competence protein ComEC